jgi:hypothetical protein
MAKPTRAELEAQLAALDDEDNVELWVEKDGVKTRLTGNHAKTWLQKLGFGDDEPDDEDPEPEPDPAPKSGYFGRKG